MEVKIFKRDNGIEPFQKFLNELRDTRAKSKILAAITKMENHLFADFKSVGGGVQESRIHHGPGYRIYFYFDGPELVVLLAGSDKDNQTKEILKAKTYLEEYKAQKETVSHTTNLQRKPK